MLAIRGGPARHSHGAPLDAGSGGSGILECEEMGFVRREWRLRGSAVRGAVDGPTLSTRRQWVFVTAQGRRT